MRGLLLILLLGAGSFSLASGQAACRVEYPWRLACYLEQDLLALGPWRVASGLEARGARVFPYLALAWQGEGRFAVLQLGEAFSLTLGWSW